MKNYFKIGAWICAVIAAIMMLLGFIAFLSGGRLINHLWQNYYYPAQNFIFFGVLFLLFILADKEKKE